MAYLSLYRKYRPRTFAEVVGQDHVTRTLINAIEEDRLHHAYLFTGQRGTGKTSTARILAAAINCENGPTPTPCGTCDQCLATMAGTNVDVVELDMASHGGVDDARGLRDDVARTPVAGRRTVYILDEVHMATNAAFNALLKVVEEPPPHVLFAMATTDPQKVLPTILSRVQRLDLRRVAAGDLTEHLARIGDQEGFALDDGAAAAVVAAGDGSVRDTLSVLEQVLAYANDADARGSDVLQVSADQVERVLGATPLELVLAVVDAIADADVAAALTGVQQLLEQGHDLRRFTLDLARHLRDLLVLRAAPEVPELVDTTDLRRERLAAQASRFGIDTLLRHVELVGEVLVEQRQGPPRLPLELAVARMATPGADGDLAALADRVARLERAGGAIGVTPAPAARPVVAPARTAPEPAATPSPVAASDAAPAPDSAAASDPASASTTPDPAPAPADRPTPAAAATASSTGTAGGVGGDEPTPADAAGRDAAEEPTVPPAAAVKARRARHDDGDPGPGEPDDVDVATPVATTDSPAAATADTDEAVSDAVDTEPVAATEPAEAAARKAPPASTEPSTPETPEEISKLSAPVEAPVEAPVAQENAEPAAPKAAEAAAPSQAAPASGRSDDEVLDLITSSWEAILEAVAETSRRAKAFYEPGAPASLRDNILVLRYPSDKRFHAEQARSGEMVGHLSAAVGRATGRENLRVDVAFEGEAVRRPKPPPMEPAHADAPAVTPQEQAEVGEAEAAPTALTDPAELDALVRQELGGQPLSDDED